MDWLSVKDAATRLGVSGSRVYQLRAAGVLASNEAGEVSRADVREHAKLTHMAAMLRIGDQDHQVLLAAGVRERLHPKAPASYPGTFGRAAIPLLDGNLVAALGFNCIEEAARPDKAGCRWCWSNVTYDIRGGVDPGDTPVYRALFAGKPCPVDRERWRKEQAAKLARAAEDAERRARGLVERAAGERAALVAAANERIRRDTAIVAASNARRVTVSRSVTASAGEDDGTSLTAKVREKLLALREEAIQRGDVTRVGELNARIRGLGQ